jgi:chemotaxis protein MotA
MVTLSEKARREGILALEEGLDELSDDFMKNGLRLVVDGTDGVIIRGIMQSEMNQIEGRHLDWINIIVAWAGLAPGYGMMGTVIGLIGMLRNLEDKSSLGPNMAVALVTTLYGSLIANWIMTPIASKLADQNATEIRTKEMIIEGVLSIQAGDNPRILAMKLLTYLDPKSRKAIEADVLKD